MAQSTKTRTKGTGRRPSAGAGAARSQAGRSRASYGTASSKSVRKNTAKGGGASSRKPAGSASGRKTAGKLAAGGGRPAHTENARRAAAREQAIRHRDARARDERNDITLVVLLIITAFLFLSLLNFGGGVGHVLAYVLFGFFGIGAWFVPFYLFAVCLFLVTGKGGARMRIRLLAILALLLILEAAGQLWLHARGVSLLNLKFNASSIFRLCANRRSGGGILGGAIAHFLYYAFRMVGSCLILFGLAIVDLLLLFPFSPTKAFGDWRKRRREDGRLSFAQRRAMRHHQMELSEWEREEERLERETDRILRRDEEAERRSSLKEARIRRKGVSPISLEQTLLKRNDEKAAERKAPQGGRRGGGKTGKAGAGSRPRREQ